MATEHIVFLKRFFSHPDKVGAFFPSSKRLADKLVSRSVKEHKGGLRYLEVGAGSGALTDSIIHKMKEGDTLALVERDPAFCQILKEKFGHLPNVTVHEVSILDFAEKEFDYVISSLPLNSFPPAFVDQVFRKFESLVKKGGNLSYFEYRWLESVNKRVLFGKALAVYKERQQVKKQFINRYCIEIKKSWSNFPPARIFHCKM